MSDLTNNVISRRTLLKAGVWFSLLNALFLLMLSLRYLSFVPDELLSSHKFYLFCLVVSHFVFLSFIPFIILYVPLTILTKNRLVSMICAAVSITILFLVLGVDSYVFALYRFHINEYVIEQIAGPDALQVFEFAIIQYLIALGLVTVVILIQTFIFRLAYRIAARSRIDRKSVV